MKISWVFDVVSPYAYLAFKRLRQLPETVTVEYVPVLFAGLLSHFGHVGPAEIAPKRRFTYRFVLWRARQLGVSMHWPEAHPFNPLTALRLIIAAGGGRESVETIFDAIFAEGRNIQDPQVIDVLASALGIGDARSAVNDPAVKERLRANTEWAISCLLGARCHGYGARLPAQPRSIRRFRDAAPGTHAGRREPTHEDLVI